MTKRIRIIKGRYNKIRISDCIFTLLKPLEVSNGITTATIDASDLLGPAFCMIVVTVEDYKLLD